MKSLSIFLGVVCMMSQALGGEGRPFLAWHDLVNLPEGLPREGSTVAESKGVFIMAGGKLSSGAFSDQVMALQFDPDGNLIRQEKARLPVPLAYSGAVSTPHGVALLGGENASGPVQAALLINWNSLADRIEIQELVPLPDPVSSPTGIFRNGKLYLIGLDNRLLSLQLEGFWELPEPAHWQHVGDFPGFSARGASSAILSDGERFHWFVFGGVDADQKPVRQVYSYGPLDSGSQSWRALRDMPFCNKGVSAVQWGNAYALLWEGAERSTRADSRMWVYHSITDSWSLREALPDYSTPVGMGRIGGNILVLSATTDSAQGGVVYLGIPERVRGLLKLVDYLIIGLYLVGLLMLGYWCSRRNSGTSDYFLAGRRIPWWAAALSLMATGVSSIGFIAIPAKSFATDWIYFSGIVTWFIVVPIVTIFFIPLIRRIDITTAYEYLEIRFNLGVRLFAGLLFILMQVGRTAVVLYLPALLLSSVLGLDIYLCIAVMGVVCIVYTVLGGMEAVVWSDVIQGIILFGGALLGIGIALAGTGMDLSELWQTAHGDGKLRTYEWGWDPTMAVIWVVIVGNIVSRFSSLTSDQTTVQRYLSTPDTRSAIRAQWADIGFSIPWAFMAFGFGTAIYLFYKSNPEKLVPGTEADSIVPLFLAQQLPVGITGLVIAALFSATMSSLDSSIHSLSTVCVRDFYGRLVKTATEARGFFAARALTIFFGLIGTLSAMGIAAYDAKSIWDLFLKIVGLFVGSLSGLFLMGIFTRFCHGNGVLLGALSSAAVVFLVSATTDLHFFLYPVVGVLICVGVGVLASVVLPSKR